MQEPVTNRMKNTFYIIFIVWLAMILLYTSAFVVGTGTGVGVDNTKCGNESSFNPKKWLIIEGIFGLVLCVSGMFSYVTMYLAKKRDCVTVSSLWIAIVCGLFLIFFNIVGAVTVFGHRGYCDKTIYKLAYGIVLGNLIAYPLVLISVIIYMGLVILGG